MREVDKRKKLSKARTKERVETRLPADGFSAALELIIWPIVEFFLDIKPVHAHVVYIANEIA